MWQQMNSVHVEEGKNDYICHGQLVVGLGEKMISIIFTIKFLTITMMNL